MIALLITVILSLTYASYNGASDCYVGKCRIADFYFDFLNCTKDPQCEVWSCSNKGLSMEGEYVAQTIPGVNGSVINGQLIKGLNDDIIYVTQIQKSSVNVTFMFYNVLLTITKNSVIFQENGNKYSCDKECNKDTTIGLHVTRNCDFSSNLVMYSNKKKIFSIPNMRLDSSQPLITLHYGVIQKIIAWSMKISSFSIDKFVHTTKLCPRIIPDIIAEQSFWTGFGVGIGGIIGIIAIIFIFVVVIFGLLKYNKNKMMAYKRLVE